MGWRFRRTFNVVPGVRLNLGKRGVSMTVGGRAARITKGRSGTYFGSSLPGTGLYYREKLGSGAPERSSSPEAVDHSQDDQPLGAVSKTEATQVRGGRVPHKVAGLTVILVGIVVCFFSGVVGGILIGIGIGVLLAAHLK